MKLIDADTLPYHRIRIFHEDPDLPGGGFAGGYTAVVMSSVINNVPAVDAVPVIRCRDCKYKNEYGQCTYYINFHHWTADMDYCSDAERRDKRNG